MSERMRRRDRRRRSAGREVLEWLATLVIAVVLAAVIHCFVFQVHAVSGDSMNPSLTDGERVITTPMSYVLGDFERGDVVITRFPDRDAVFIKRIVALPGETVAVHDGAVWINGEPLDEPYAYAPTYTLEATVVPEGKLFLLGDNRNISNDSHLIGFIDTDMVIGKVQCVFWPLDRFRMVEAS